MRPTPRRGLAGVVLVAGIALLVGSCQDVVGEPGYDAARAMCDVLSRCYGTLYSETCDVIDERLADESTLEVDRRAFLGSFEENGCATSCPKSRACLDQPALCGTTGGDCADDAECCGVTEGLATCRELAEGTKKCCIRNGARCESDADCCDAPCRSVGEQRFCGGYRCTVVGEACDSGFDCCTGLCVEGACVASTCAKLGEPCDQAEDCCPISQLETTENAVVTGVDCVAGGCALAEDGGCGGEQSPCDPSASSTENACCDGLFCLGGPGGASFCVGGCLFSGFDCAIDDDCCSGYCVVSGSGSACSDGACTPPGGTCSGDSECCSESCLQGVCTRDCGADGVCHSPCVVGVAFADTNCLDPVQLDAFLNVTTQGSSGFDPYCACIGWDSICVAAAAALGACGT